MFRAARNYNSNASASGIFLNSERLPTIIKIAMNLVFSLAHAQRKNMAANSPPGTSM